MAAGQGFKTFTTGEVLTAGDVNGYLMQGINVFASNAARDAAITSPQEGQFAYTKDTNSLWYYTGSAWAASGATGDIEGVTAGVGISGGGTSGTVTITNDMATTITTNGDLLYGTGSGTYTRRAIGTTGQVLTVSGGVPTWATVSSTPTFVGCRVYVSTDTSIPASTDVIINFNNENFDTNAFHDTSVNTSRMTIPTGYAGKYLVQANVAYSGNSTSNRVINILKNGSIVATVYSGQASSNAFTIPISLMMDLAVGDYLQVQTNSQGAGTTLTVFGSNSLSPNQAATAFQLQYLGA